MKYIFTSQYLKVLPPATSFGEAWELLCWELLRAENPTAEFQRLLPPDRGVDILRSSPATAYQCKSDERGTYGNAPMRASLESLTTAVDHRTALGWNDYCFATNADYSGMAVEEIRTAAESLGLSKSLVSFFGPQHWSDLCDKHLARVQEHLDYRLQVTEQQVVEAFRMARFREEEKVEDYRKQIAAGQFVVDLANNRTPLRLTIPFSPDLTVRHCLKVAMQLLNVTLDSEEYSDLETSARPSVSITVDRIPQGFDKKLGEFTANELGRLQLWITVIWKDEQEEPSGRRSFLARVGAFENLNLDPRQRSAKTLERYERSMQLAMWRAADALRDPGTRAEPSLGE